MALNNDREYALEERKIRALEKIGTSLERLANDLPSGEETKLFFAQTELGLRHISDRLGVLQTVSNEIASLRSETHRSSNELHDIALNIRKERR